VRQTTTARVAVQRASNKSSRFFGISAGAAQDSAATQAAT
jgi:hypothetical protein